MVWSLHQRVAMFFRECGKIRICIQTWPFMWYFHSLLAFPFKMIKDPAPFNTKAFTVFTWFRWKLPAFYFISLFLFLSVVKTRNATLNTPCWHERASKQFQYINSRFQHFSAAVANCCFDCFQVQLLAALGQIKDKHAETKPGN